MKSLKITSMAMKRRMFPIKKWIARVLVTTGAVWGLTSCHSTKKDVIDPTDPRSPYYSPGEPQPLVYGPPPGMIDAPVRRIKPEPDVYGPPPQVLIDNDTVKASIKKK